MWPLVRSSLLSYAALGFLIIQGKGSVYEGCREREGYDFWITLNLIKSIKILGFKDKFLVHSLAQYSVYSEYYFWQVISITFDYSCGMFFSYNFTESFNSRVIVLSLYSDWYLVFYFYLLKSPFFSQSHTSIPRGNIL